MGTFKNKEDLQTILNKLWDMIFSNPEIIESVSGEKLIVKFRYTDFETSFYIDLTGERPTYYWDPADKVASDVEMILSSETAHKFWLEQLNVPLAIASRKIVAKGSIQKALKLLPALKPAFPLYPEVLVQLGRGDLVVSRKTAGKRKRKLTSLFRKKRSGSYDFDKLPEFPMDHTEKLVANSGDVKSIAADVSKMDILESMLTIRHFH